MPVVALVLAMSPLVVVHPLHLSGRSMEPTLRNGELRWVLQTWCASPPQRGEVWIVESPDGVSIKRVVGLPRDHVESKDGEIFINGLRLDESYVQRGDHWNGVWDCGNGYLALGDNRPESHDGRAWGALPRSAFRGRVLGLHTRL